MNLVGDAIARTLGRSSVGGAGVTATALVRRRPPGRARDGGAASSTMSPWASAGRDPRPRRRVGQRQDDDRAGAARLRAARASHRRRRRRGRRQPPRAARRAGARASRPADVLRAAGPGELAQPGAAIGQAIRDMLDARAARRRAASRAAALAVVHLPADRGVRAALPAPALGRPAAARDDRDRARLRAAAGRPRRADDRPRRRHTGPRPRRDRPPARRARPGAWSTSRTTSPWSRRSPTASP